MTMSTVAEPLTANLLYRQQRAQIDLVHEAEQQLAKYRETNEQAQALLEQVVRMCLHAPAMLRDLWDWLLQQDRAGRLRDRPLVGKDLRDQFCDWLDLLDLMHQRAGMSEAAGYPIQGAKELLGAADEVAAIAQEVNQAWPIEELPPPAASTGLSYQQLRSLADQPPAVGDWPEEDFDRS
jgi:hypothetical protein